MIEAWKVVSFLLRISRGVPWARFRTGMAVIMAVVCGMVYPGLLALINLALSRPFDRRIFVAFAVLFGLAPLTRLMAQTLFTSVAMRAIFDLRLRLCHDILATPLRNLEEIGDPRLMASLVDDVASISTAVNFLPPFWMQLALIAAAMVYMAWLSPTLFLLVLGGFVLALGSFRLPFFRTGRYFERLRKQTNVMFAHFRDLLYGSKELKLHRRRREAFIATELIPTGEEMRHSQFVGNSVFTAANAWGNLLFFSVLGVLIFGLARPGPGMKVLAGYTLALLYLKTPLEIMLLSLPPFARAAAACTALETLGLQLTATDGLMARGREHGSSWRSVELVDVVHAYGGGGEERAFSVGPLRLTLTPGEIVFLIGGNGSGKTTLAKILTGLYKPDQGEVRLNGVAVTDANRDEYRQMFAAVFSSFFLFKRLVGQEGEDVDALSARYLEQFGLDGKVRVEGGVFSTIDLSQGQRKRLALIATCLEDRPIYLFDEWAADQDPHFKEIYYREILPGLKAQGKTVVVISHDDRYYALADRLIKLTNGRIEWEKRPDEAAGPALERGLLVMQDLPVEL
jgi:putative ATP-binding cassette transporter